MNVFPYKLAGGALVRVKCIDHVSKPGCSILRGNTSENAATPEL